MNKPNNLPYYFEWSRQFPHVAAADLYGKNIANEIVVLTIDNRNGDLYFIRLDQLDTIDIKRLRQIVLSRDSARYALWDLMSQKTLANGMNALEYFHQLVLVRTVGGEIIKPGQGSRGLPVGQFGYTGPTSAGFVIPEDAKVGKTAQAPAQATQAVTELAEDFEYTPIDGEDDGELDEAPIRAIPAKKKAGRPAKKKS